MSIFTTTYSKHLDSYHINKLKDRTLASQQLLNQFLSSIERKAFRIADIATGNKDDALELVQEAMISLVKNYSTKPENDWPALFHRILQSKIRDHYRRTKVRNKIRGWLRFVSKEGDEDNIDPIQQVADTQNKCPQESLANEDSGKALNTALKALPLRQQQAFLLRNWQAMSVAETAAAMSCSESSVKTHYSRAIRQLRTQLEDHQS